MSDQKILETEKLDIVSLDIAAQKRDELVSLFPEVRTEGGKIDFERLKAVLGEVVDAGRERYGMNWPGKAECMRTIQAPSMGTLLPLREQSVDWDTTENVIIEGDNLEVLKLLQKSYLGKVKMIYIDPPYNTGNDFIYPDNYSETLQTYLEYTGQVDANGRKFGTNNDSDGRFHSKWLNLIYPRLYLGRSLLSEDGFIVASIDDAELVNFRRIFDEVFGEENYIATLVYDRNRKNDAKLFSVGHEYMLVYARNKSLLRETDLVLRAPKEGIEEARRLFDSLVVKHGSNFEKIQEEWRSHFAGLEAEHEHKPLGRFSKIQSIRGPFRDDGDISWPGGKGPNYEVLHPKTLKPCKTPKGGWVYPTKASFDEAVRKGRVVFGPDETTLPRQMRYLFESVGEVMRSVMFSYAQTATVELSKLMGGRVFENPKNYKDLQTLVSYLTAPGDLVLDFFAGSGSLGHAVLGCNDAGQGNRKFMLVQLPEPTEIEEYPTIASLTRDRIRRAGRQISEGQTGLPFSESDLGFRAFSLAPSSFIPWDGIASNDADQLAKQLQLGIENTRDDRKPEDLLFEVLLKSWGEPALSLKVGVEAIDGVGVFSIAEGAFLICLEEQVTLQFIRALAARKPDRVVMRESAFAGNDQLKTNAVQTFKSHGVTSFKVV